MFAKEAGLCAECCTDVEQAEEAYSDSQDYTNENS